MKRVAATLISAASAAVVLASSDCADTCSPINSYYCDGTLVEQCDASGHPVVVQDCAAQSLTCVINLDGNYETVESDPKHVGCAPASCGPEACLTTGDTWCSLNVIMQCTPATGGACPSSATVQDCSATSKQCTQSQPGAATCL